MGIKSPRVVRIDCACTDDKCPVWSTCAKLPTEVYLNDDGKVDLLFVGTNGGTQDIEKKRPFSDDTGMRLRNQVVVCRKKVGKYIGVAFTNIVRDCTGYNNTPTTKQKEHCSKLLFRDIKTLRNEYGVRCIVTLGNVAKKELIKECQYCLLRDSGKFYKINVEGVGAIPVLASYHPTWMTMKKIEFNESNLHERDQKVIDQILKAYNYMEGQDV